MVKKSFKENNPVTQFITPEQVHQEEQNLQSGEETQDEKVGKKVKRLRAKEAAEKKNRAINKVKKLKTKEPEEEKDKDKEGQIGKKLPRMNKALTKDNFRYLQDIAHVEGVSITEYVNRIVDADQARQLGEHKQLKTNSKE
jgi:isopropylmalate/homocitrate/citramalate synthase